MHYGIKKYFSEIYVYGIYEYHWAASISVLLKSYICVASDELSYLLFIRNACVFVLKPNRRYIDFRGIVTHMAHPKKHEHVRVRDEILKHMGKGMTGIIIRVLSF